MTDNELLLEDRLQKIRQVINKYGEDNFYISYSGGKDSCVLSDLIDWALPDNKIPRVFVNTGIELNIIVDFVRMQKDKDNRIIIINPSKSIKKTLEEFGYPFKSKEHSQYVEIFQRLGYCKTTNRYLYPDESRKQWGCPNKLKYQFTNDFKMKISDMCCVKLKEEPIQSWSWENEKPYAILGLMAAEGGRRNRVQCLSWRNKNLYSFNPLSVLDKKWEDWFIENYDVDICNIYKEPYNFPRTGCKGCPFNPRLQETLDVLEHYFPNERRQCEYIWGPVYNEYRRIGYRLKNK